MRKNSNLETRNYISQVQTSHKLQFTFPILTATYTNFPILTATYTNFPILTATYTNFLILTSTYTNFPILTAVIYFPSLTSTNFPYFNWYCHTEFP